MSDATIPIPLGSQLSIVNREARQKTAQRVRKKVQHRTPFSEIETIRLMGLIEEHGVSWTLLKDEDSKHADGEVLGDRSQVSLKDKARNMKMDFLK